ncbi:hypothetical protein IMX26_12130 [Clostridium sp. 'deep sea']|uniref:hypothetical protein n=1 Tax=Clostridium sp. 'deep sea' TaxID=2779445 RepID=UPI0018964ED7|nr:hypothetical protein [Clostridium sp. 'deep sea']QOR34235.1 hypothetical protein IMX26_12130 [Clostridium sp. 'deep sea']
MKIKLRRLTMIFGIIAGIIGALVPLVGIFISGSIGIVLLKSVVVFFVLTMIFMMGSMLVDSNIIIKLTVLPITYLIIMVGYIIYQLKVHVFFIGALGGDIGNATMEIGEGVSVAKLSMMLQGGTLILCIPLIIAINVKLMKLNKRNNIDFSTYDATEGTISNIVDTHTKINRVKSYKITIDIPYYRGEAYQVTKDFLVPMHIIHTIALGKKVTVKVNPKKREEVYIKSEYGIL